MNAQQLFADRSAYVADLLAAPASSYFDMLDLMSSAGHSFEAIDFAGNGADVVKSITAEFAKFAPAYLASLKVAAL